VKDMDDLDRSEIIEGFLKSDDYQSAECFARSIEDKWQRAESLAQLARVISSNGQLNEARRLWREAIAVAQAGENSQSMQDSLDSSSVLWEIAEDMALAGNIDAACNVAANIKSEHKRQRALSYVAEIASGGTGSFYRLRNTLSV
jgi:hypothetical protein